MEYDFTSSVMSLNRLTKNEISFGINKFEKMIIKPLNFVNSHSFKDPTFHRDIYSIPKVLCYTYLGIPFSNDLLLQSIMTKL